MKTLFKRMLCLLAVMAIVLTGTGSLYAQAATPIITVKNALSNETLYSGNDLQEAFDAAERGSIVSIAKNLKVASSVTLDVEIMLIGYEFIERYLSRKVQILLTGDGAIFMDSEIKAGAIAALYSYSTVEMTEENNGYVYYLVTQAPSLQDKLLSVKVANDLYGAKVDEDTGIIYLDGLYTGMSTDALASAFSMEAENADGVDVSFEGAVKVDGVSCVATGTKLVVTAANYDYDGVISRKYQIVVLGDVNGNGRIDAADASLTLRHANGVTELTELALLAADADNDGAVTAADADTLCKKYVRGGYKSSL